MAYEGFEKLRKKLMQEGSKNPSAVAASIAKKKYGEKSLEKHAKNGISMEHTKHLKKFGG